MQREKLQHHLFVVQSHCYIFLYYKNISSLFLLIAKHNFIPSSYEKKTIYNPGLGKNKTNVNKRSAAFN